MDPVVVIGTRSEGVTVLDVRRLPDDAGDQVLVEISRGGLTAARWVFLLDGSDLVRYFSRLSQRWRGWHDTKEWTSLEGDLEIQATHTGAHVDFVVSLRSAPTRSGSPRSASPWRPAPTSSGSPTSWRRPFRREVAMT